MQEAGPGAEPAVVQRCRELEQSNRELMQGLIKKNNAITELKKAEATALREDRREYRDQTHELEAALAARNEQVKNLEEALSQARPQLDQLSKQHERELSEKDEELTEMREALMQVRGMIEQSAAEWRLTEDELVESVAIKSAEAEAEVTLACVV